MNEAKPERKDNSMWVA